MIKLAIAGNQLPPGVRTITAAPHRLEAAYHARWNQLCVENAAYARPFLSADFAAAVSMVRPAVKVCVFLHHDEPVAFFPYQFASWRHAALGWADPVGSWMSDYFGVVAAPGITFQPAALMRAAGLSYIYFAQLDETQSQTGLTGERPVTGLIVRFEGGAEEYWKEISARDRSFANDTRRSTRQLEERIGPLRFEIGQVSSSAELDRIIREKRDQYARTNSKDALAQPWTHDLLHQLLKSDMAYCAPSLTTLYAGDTWAASHFGLRFGGCLHYWFPVYDQELRRYSPGRLLVKAMIDHAAQLGIQSLDCGIGEARYKASFANQSHTLYHGTWMSGGVKSFLSRATQSLRWRLAAKEKPE